MAFQEFAPSDYLKIDIANNFGLDKLKWDQRIEWFNKNQDLIEACDDSLLQQADNPAQFHAGIQAWKNTRKGEPSGYLVSLDATSSGIQLLASLTHDRMAATICNVLDIGDRANAYEIIYEIMKMRLPAGIVSSLDPDDVKSAIMTSLYGSTARPKRVFGEGSKLYYTFLEVMEIATPMVWKLNKLFLDIWDKTASQYGWVLPDNFHVIVKVQDSMGYKVNAFGRMFEGYVKVQRPTEEGRSLCANVTHAVDAFLVREITNRASITEARKAQLRTWIDLLRDPKKRTQFMGDPDLMDPNNEMVSTLMEHANNTGYLSSRILNHLTLKNLALTNLDMVEEELNSLPSKTFDVLTVHDCFRVHPNYGNDIRREYQYQLHKLAKSTLLGNILKQLTGKDVTMSHRDPEFAANILDSNYALS